MKHRILIVAAILAATGAAHAQMAAPAPANPAAAAPHMLTLKCDYSGGGSFYVNIDMAKSMIGATPVSISPTDFYWSQHAPAGANGITADTSNHIDRTTGAYTSMTQYHLSTGENRVGSSSAQCAPATPVTKF